MYLHPAGGVRWTELLEKLAQTHTVHLPTFPGFDGTPVDSDLKSRRDLGVAIGRVHRKHRQAGATSWAARSAARWRCGSRSSAPSCVDHLVLEGPAGLQAIDRALRNDPQAFRQALFVHPEKISFEKKPEAVEAQNRRMLSHYGAEDGKDAGLLPRLAEIQHTVLILHGTEDRITGRESVQLLKSRLKRSFLVYVWDAAHNIEVDQPERMLALVESFLERSDAFMVNYA